jgi:hypothetical protein
MISLALVEGGWVQQEKDEVEADDENEEQKLEDEVEVK